VQVGGKVENKTYPPFRFCRRDYLTTSGYLLIPGGRKNDRLDFSLRARIVPIRVIAGKPMRVPFKRRVKRRVCSRDTK